MGADFLKRTRETYEKSIDSGLARLRTPDLFTQTPQNQPRSAIGYIKNGVKIRVGDILILECVEKEIVASKGNIRVALIKNPSPVDFQSINSTGGVGKGEVCKVFGISNTVEISYC